MGCAIWAYREWIGEFYPAGSRPGELLSLYSRRLTTVEGNTTFYSVPDRATIDRWVEETPPGFEFCLKLPRTVTHQGKLAAQGANAIAFLKQMQGLGDRLGPLFAQLPPSYGPDAFDDLRQFLHAWPREARLAVEVRHRDWFQAPYATQLHTLLAELNLGRVLLDSRPIYDCPDDPQLHSERRKPRVPLHMTMTTDFSLIRYISHPKAGMNQVYLQAWATQIESWLRQDKRIYFFVHCPLEQRSPTNVRYFQQLLEQQGAPVPDLPWNALEAATTQLSLF